MSRPSPLSPRAAAYDFDVVTDAPAPRPTPPQSPARADAVPEPAKPALAEQMSEPAGVLIGRAR